jgi:hypothetical protein
MNILIDLLPSSVKIDGTEYEINSDFRTSVLFSLLMEDDSLNEEEKVLQAVNLYYPVIPNNIGKAIEQIKWFYSCGKSDKPIGNKKRKTNSKKVFDFEVDANYIYSAFMSQYNIDLQDIGQLHWWKFKALLEGLKEDNKLSKIIQYRSMDLSKIKDKEQRKFYKDMQKQYSLKKESEEELKLLEEWNKKLRQL